MDTSKVSQGELIAGAGGLLLFLFMFLDWSVGGFNAWEIYSIVDLLFAVIALGTAAVVGARLAGSDVGVPGIVIFLGGFFAFSVTFAIVLDSDGKKIGVWLAMLASAAIAYGGYEMTSGGASRTPPPSAPA